jgi:N-acetyl-anhydromuramyl-L-alanine amidase AmpD
MDKTHINIHHTAMYAEDDVAEQFDAVNNSHRIRWGGKTKSKLGFYGGYHYIIERNGVVQQFRSEDEDGAHNNKGVKRIGAWWYSANSYAIGISFAGNMSRQQLTKAQIVSAIKLINDVMDRNNIPPENILPHRDYKPTQCPGLNIPDKVWEYLLDQYAKLATVEPSIVKWHKENKIIEHWSEPIQENELKLGWAIYKALRANKDNNLKFNL